MEEDYYKIQNKWLSIAGSSMWVEEIAKKREERIRERAYFIYLDRIRNNKEGDTLSDWLNAEREVDLDFF
ncbi:MAG TPA: DUF2934 domain-containing protein [Spirochaetota bacterium]|nr:DUF2934 domain-containing protein [Spirochaetota bacterium]HOL57975.1 DUF2934 domain-containing protein [Spirochaetota bacterium]HPP05514.1 DUF2934 domain-containing protein [Spirochaetota bacterium]